MALLWQNYYRPASLLEALQILSSAPGPACPIAGGTDLLLEFRQGRRQAVCSLVDISHIPDMTVQEVRGTELFIGAAVSMSRVIDSPLIQKHAQALVEACQVIGGLQVRNVATLGGNVAHALPAADGAIALLAMGAEAEVASLSFNCAEAQTTNARRVPLLDLYLGPGKSALKPGELLVGFYIPLGASGEGSAFTRVMRSQGVGLAIVNLAVRLKRENDAITDLRIAVGPAGPIPQVVHLAEQALRGQALTPETLSAAETALLAETHFRTSPQRATAGYRRHLVGHLLVDAIHTAWERAA